MAGIPNHIFSMPTEQMTLGPYLYGPTLSAGEFHAYFALHISIKIAHLLKLFFNFY